MPKTPMRLATKLGVSLPKTMPLPRRKRPKSAMKLMHLGGGVLAGDQLEQPHVADGVEEVGDQEVLAEVLRAALGHAADGQARGVGGDDGPRLADLLDPGEELLLDVEPLHHHLDDPVALRQPVPVVLEVARPRSGAGSAASRGGPAWPSSGPRPPPSELVAETGVARGEPVALSSSLSLGGTMSSSTTEMPALARWAAMPEPMTPAPSTPTRRISLRMENLPNPWCCGFAQSHPAHHRACRAVDE